MTQPEPRYSSSPQRLAESYDQAVAEGKGTAETLVPLVEPDVVPGVPPRGPDRIDEYDTVGPNGEIVHVTHNLETGETTVVE